jgi:hypothetical protein
LRLADSAVLVVGGVDFAGMTLDRAPGGEMTAGFERLCVRNFERRTALTSLEVEHATLDGLTAEVPAASGAALQVRACAVRQIRLQGVRAVLNDVRRLAGARVHSLQLDALRELDGLIRAHITDALWLVDAEVAVPFAKGQIDFNRVELEHVGPNSTIGFGPAGVHVEGPFHLGRVELIVFGDKFQAPTSAAHAPMARNDRGCLDIAALIDAVMRTPPDEPFALVAHPKLAGPVRRTRVSGELRLGDGAMGNATQQCELTGRDDGKNRIEVSAAAVGECIVVGMPQFAARGASFGSADKRVTVASMTATLEARIVASARDGAKATQWALEISIPDATFCDVKLASVDSESRRAGS